jgi:hypothetical protein
MDALRDRVVARALRLASTALVFAGVALFVAGIPVLPAASGTPRDILMVVLQIGAVLVLFGFAAIRAARRPPLSPEADAADVTDGARLGGWMLLLAVALVAVPVWLLVRLQPFLSEWRVVGGLLASSELWRNANANMSGVVLLPLFAALTPPFIQLAALAAFVVSSAVLLLLLATKSPRFSRLFVATVLVLTALVVASARGASAVSKTADALQPFIEESKSRPQEYAEIRGIVDRYMAAVKPTAAALGWAGLGYAIWIPPLILSARRRQGP